MKGWGGPQPRAWAQGPGPRAQGPKGPRGSRGPGAQGFVGQPFSGGWGGKNEIQILKIYRNSSSWLRFRPKFVGVDPYKSPKSFSKPLRALGTQKSIENQRRSEKNRKIVDFPYFHIFPSASDLSEQLVSW